MKIENRKVKMIIAVIVIALCAICFYAYYYNKTPNNMKSLEEVASQEVDLEKEIQSDEWEHAEYDYPAMIMVQDVLYYDSGEISTEARCGMMDGEITTMAEPVPSENDQSNFGIGYGYQYGTENTIDVCMDDGWHTFVLYEKEKFDEVDKLIEQKIVESNREEIMKQIAAIIGEAEKSSYVLENYEFEIVSAKEKRVDCTFWADWKRIREPKDDPFIQGMYDAVAELSDETEREHAKEIADGWLKEKQAEPEVERLDTQIVILFDEEDNWALYYPYRSASTESLILLEEFVAEYWTEDTKARRQSGIDIIEEEMNWFRKQ